MDWDNIKDKLIQLENECYEYNQIYYIYLGLINDLDVSKYQSIEFDCFQMEQIYLGLLNGINVDDYAFPDIPANKMATIRNAKEIGSFDQIMLDPTFSSKEIYQISKEFNASFTYQKKRKKSNDDQNEIIISDEEIDAISIDDLFEDEDYDELDFDEFVQPEILLEEENDCADDYYDFYSNFTLCDNTNFFKGTFSRYPLLNAEEETKIANEFKDNDFSSWDRFLLSNIKLVFSVVNKYSTRFLTKDDLFQIGFTGLMYAAKRYNPDFGTRFSTYAVSWIRQAITRGIADYNYLIRIPVHFQEQLRKFNRLSKNEDGEQNYEIAKNNYLELKENLSKEEYDYLIQISELNHFEEITPELLDENFSYTHDYYKDILKEKINEALSCLTEREEKVLRLRFGLDDGFERTLEEVGNEFNVSRERIRQIEVKAITKIKQSKGLRQLEAFFEVESEKESLELNTEQYDSGNSIQKKKLNKSKKHKPIKLKK